MMIPGGRWYGIILNLLLAALGVSGAAFYAVSRRAALETPVPPAAACLEIRDAGSGRVYGRWPLGAEGEFAVEFIHSVNQSPVREFFRAEGGQIRPVAVRFTSFGAGMPGELAAGQELSRDGDALVVTGFSQSFPELDYIVGTVSDHLLLAADQTVSLRNLCGKNARIKMTVR